MYNSPRAATVSCKSEGVLWALPGTIFRTLVSNTHHDEKHGLDMVLAGVRPALCSVPSHSLPLAARYATQHRRSGAHSIFMLLRSPTAYTYCVAKQVQTRGMVAWGGDGVWMRVGACGGDGVWMRVPGGDGVWVHAWW